MVKNVTENNVCEFVFHKKSGYKVLDPDTLINTNDPRIFQGNIPDTEEAYETGNGMSCYFLPYSDKDYKKYLDNESNGESIKAIILNDAYEIKWGTLLTLETRGPYMPVLPWD